jgi:hypothetical protein
LRTKVKKVPLASGFVNKSAKFLNPATLAIRTIFAATDSLTLCYAIALCFFFNTEVGVAAFNTTDWLSMNKFVASSIATPNMHNLEHRAMINSIAIRVATKSAPKVEDSIAF